MSFNKGFCTVYFGEKVNNVVNFPHSAQMKHTFLGKINEMPKKKTIPARKKIALELLHQRLGHRSTISFLSGDTNNIWEDVQLRIDPDPFLHIMSNFLNEQKG